MTSRYEPISNIDEEYRNSCFPVELLQGIHNSYRVEYDNCSLVFAQKDFHMAKQFSLDTSVGTIFLRRRCLK